VKDILKKINRQLTIKNVSSAAILLNLASIVLGIIYLAIQIYSIMWDIFGVILFITLFGNLLLVYLNTIKLNKNTELGNRLNILCYIYLIFIIIAMLLMPASNFLISVTYSNAVIDNIGTYGMVIFFYFGVMLLGMFISLVDFKNLDNRELWDLETKGVLTPSKKILLIKKILKIILGLISILTLLLGIFLAYSLLTAGWVLGMVLPEFAFALSFIILSTTIILLKMINRKKKVKIHYGIAIIGLVVSGILLVPLFLTSYSIYSAEASFTETFGDDWRSEIDPDVEEKYFMKTHFSIPGLFLGIKPKECNYKVDISFFDGSKSNYSEDEDIELFFDVFWPKNDADDLPGQKDGKYSIIIKIHGGGWKYGDKGVGHMMQVNKYFAAQGYIVYDIQYGLKETKGALSNILPTPENVLGDFDVDDMVRHIGNFTQYIAKDSNDYSADELDGNLDCVFVSGGSAGGHLTCTTALAIANGGFPEIFGTSLTIKGQIPFYPANGHSRLEGDTYGEVFDKPEKHLIDKDSPPCLIYQGTHDKSCASVSRVIKEEYDEVGNDECCIIWLPMSGHANDVYFSGYYNQVFLYYMERFLYLCVNDKIV